MHRILPIALIAIVCGGLAGGVIGAIVSDAGAAPAGVAPTPATSTSQAEAPTATSLYRRDAPGVVVITATEKQQIAATPFTPPTSRRVQSLGSGFVLDARGDIVTNDHVVAGANGIRVGFDRGASYPATVVGTDPSSDLAVVRVDAPASMLHPIAFDSSSGVRVGEPVYAIGNPFGLDRTMTAGIVSATGRDIQSPNGLTIPNAIQTDAPINHGNSGGPLLDGSGHVVGITSQIQGGTVDANVGVGFAIPSDTASKVAQDLISNGSAQHAWLGVQVRPAPRHGVLVASVVPGSPAARDGLRGDAILAIDGRTIDTPAQLAEAVARRRPGDAIRLKTVRGGTSRQVTVTLANAPAQVS